MARLRWVTLGVALAAYAGACSYPTFSFTTGGSSSTGGNGGGASSSSDGAGASTSVSSSSGGPPMCRLVGHPEDCKTNERCTIQDEGTGDTHCVTLDASPLSPYAACSDVNDTRCPKGTWCDHHTKVCKPMCTAMADCPSHNCIQALTTGGNAISGLKVCLAHCDPVLNTPCDLGATCVYDKTEGDLDCARSNGVQPGDPCSKLADCTAGFVCAGTCEPWCSPAISQSTCAPGDCTEFADQIIMFNGDFYGYVCP